MLEELDWMDEDTRAKALNKIDLMVSHIAYSNEILDTEILDQFYDGLTLRRENSYLGNTDHPGHNASEFNLIRSIYDSAIQNDRNGTLSSYNSKGHFV